MRLAGFQEAMLSEHFAGATETLILIPKKNAKSTTLAALALFHLIGTRDAECVIAAASRDQATILYDQAAGFVHRSDRLQEFVAIKRGYREIRSRKHRGRIRVLAADVDTADGVIPTLALVDELHRHRSAELYGVFRDGLGPRGGQMITISTAGADPQSPLGLMRKAASELPTVERDGAHRRAISRDGSYVMHEWALDPEDDVDDMRVVKDANPAPWHTLSSLKRRHDSPSMTPWQWARFGCNIWQAAENPWLPRGAWEALEDPVAEIPAGAAVWIGVDLGVKHDSAALVVCWERSEHDVVVAGRVLEPPPDGESLDIAEVEQAIRDCADRWDVQAATYDPWRFQRSAQLLGDEGLFMVEHPMTNARMAPESEQLYQAINEGWIKHDGDPVLAAHVLAGVTTDTERGWRLTKRKARDKIDALIALVIAYDLVARKPTAAPAKSRVPVSL